MHAKRDILLYAVLLTALSAICAAALFAGAVRVPLSDIADSPIVRLRVARILLGLVAGAGLSVAGVVFQAVLRNPLAEPYVLGVSSGAGLAAATAILLNLTAWGVWTLPGMAFIGAMLSVLAVYFVAREASGAVPVHTLLLSGVIAGSVLGSALLFLVSVGTSDELHNVMWWLLGNLQISDWSLLRAAAIVVSAGLAVAILLARDLNVMTLGDEPARHLGLDVNQARKLFFVVGSLITGAVVAACGLIGFVGLIVPHMVRLAVGPDHRRLVPASAIAGAGFLVLADAFARTVIAPTEIPTGVITAFLGGPFFLYLLRHRKRWG